MNRKLVLLISILLVCLISFVNCKDEAPVPSKHTLITQGSWKMTAHALDPAYDGITNWYTQYPPCEQDNLLKFKLNGTYIQDEGPTKCDPDDDQVFILSTWTFNVTGNLIHFGNGIEWNVDQLTSDRLIISYTSMMPDGYNHKSTKTYVGQ